MEGDLGVRRQAAEAPRPLTDLIARLEAPPFGLRSGPFPVLLALYLRVFGDRVALYEDGLFVPDTGIETLEASSAARRPSRSGHCGSARPSGGCCGLSAAPSASRTPRGTTSGCSRSRAGSGGAVRLPAYARQTRRIGDDSRRVRDELLSARDPRDLVLRDLPKALGLASPTRGRTDGAEYAARLGMAVEEIGAAYPSLLRRLERELGRAVAAELRAGGAPAERAETDADLPRRLREEAMRLREHATELTLRQFLEAALRTDDDRTDWRETLALPLGDGLPADRWNDDRAERAEARIRLLAHEMARLGRLVDSRAAEGVSSRAAAAEGNGAPANGAANGNGAPANGAANGKRGGRAPVRRLARRDGALHAAGTPSRAHAVDPAHRTCRRDRPARGLTHERRYERGRPRARAALGLPPTVRKPCATS